jgi:hypothetical protein
MAAAKVPDHVKKMLDKAQARKRREDLATGKYEVLIWALTHERRENREKLGKVFWIDYVIDKAEAIEGEGEPTPVGSKLDCPIVLDGANSDMAWGDLKTFLMELTGCGEDEVSEMYGELTDNVTEEGNHSAPGQMARGMRAKVTTRKHKVKSGKNIGQTKIYPKWFHMEQTADEIEAARKRLEKQFEQPT